MNKSILYASVPLLVLFTFSTSYAEDVRSGQLLEQSSTVNLLFDKMVYSSTPDTETGVIEAINALTNTKTPEQKEQEVKNKFVKTVKDFLTEKRVSVQDSWLTAIYDKSKIKQVDPYLVSSVIYYESTFDPKEVSSYQSCCRGLMQVSKFPVKWYNDKYGTKYTVDSLFDPIINLEIWINYLDEKIEAQGGSEQLALLSYNGGEGYMNRMISNGTISTTYTTRILELRKVLSNTK